MPPETPVDVKTRLDRGRKEMRKDAAKRRLCIRFERGDTYWFLTDKGVLNYQPTSSSVGAGKPPHRIRNAYNYIRPIIESKISAATQKVPSYDITPTSTDPTVIQAASLAEKVALYGYDEWGLRLVTEKTVKLALAGGGDGFCLPYFDPNVGPYTNIGGEWVGQGEVKHLVLSGNEVYWEAGTDFQDSPWYAIERARPLDEVKQTPGFIPGTKLSPDASTSDIPTDRDSANNVMVTEYFERPSPKYPDGRCVVIANGKPIVDYRLIDQMATDLWGPYPLQDVDGTVLDEPILHRLRYTVDADKDRDLGLTWQLIDFQRTIQDCWNKLLEYKNRGLNPQMKAPIGSIVTPPDDVPGAIRYYKIVAGREPEWEQPITVPQALFQILERAVSDMKEVAADFNMDMFSGRTAGATITAALEQSMNRWASFLGDLAEWHSKVMRHSLLLVARHYSENRLLEIRGRDGWELIPNFRGAHLMGQTSVRVNPNSLTPTTRQGVQDQLTWLAQQFPGFLTPDSALEAMASGSTDRLTQSYWLDVGQANTVIQKIQDGTVMDMPPTGEIDPATGQPVPGWMPTEVSNLTVWKQVFGDYMKTDSYTRLAPPQQEVCRLVWQGIQALEDQKAQRQALLQQQMASQLGMANAAAPQNGKPMPSLPGGTQPAVAGPLANQ